MWSIYERIDLAPNVWLHSSVGRASHLYCGSSVEALLFSGLLLSNCLNWKIYCNDHSSLSDNTVVCFSCRIQDFVNVEKASPDQMNSNVIWGYTQKRSHFFAASATRRLVEVIISANIWRLMTMKEKKPASIKVLKKIVLTAAQNFFKWTTMMAMVSMSRIEHFHFQILAFHFWNHLFGYQNFHDFVYTQIICERKQFSNTLSIKCF